MTREIDRVTQAFPGGCLPDNYEEAGAPFNPGMDLRDWFAGQALVGLARVTRLSDSGDTHVYPPDQIAEWAYCCADSMMAERGRGV